MLPETRVPQSEATLRRWGCQEDKRRAGETENEPIMHESQRSDCRRIKAAEKMKMKRRQKMKSSSLWGRKDKG